MARQLRSRNELIKVKIPINKEVTAYYQTKLGYNINRLHPGLRLFIYTEFYQSPISIAELERNKKLIVELTKRKLFRYKLNKQWLYFWELYKRRLWPKIYLAWTAYKY